MAGLGPAGPARRRNPWMGRERVLNFLASANSRRRLQSFLRQRPTTVCSLPRPSYTHTQGMFSMSVRRS
eukprot:scaffold138752_cov47-Prasinocladus_malaysianus.AAC.1